MWFTLLLGLGCGILLGFGITFASWIGIDPAASCCPVNPLDPLFGALLGTASALWGRVMRIRYEQDDEHIRVFKTGFVLQVVAEPQLRAALRCAILKAERLHQQSC